MFVSQLLTPEIFTQKPYYLQYCLANSLSIFLANSYPKLTHVAVAYLLKFWRLSLAGLHGFSLTLPFFFPAFSLVFPPTPALFPYSSAIDPKQFLY